MEENSNLATSQHRFRRLSVAVALGLAVFGLTDVRHRARIDYDRPESHRTDLTIFTGAGAAFFADVKPYEFANPRGWRYAYPPFLALVLAPLSRLAPQWQAVIWYALSCGMAWLAWGEVVRISVRMGIDIRLTPGNRTAARWVGWLAVGTILLPALNCLQRGQVGLANLWLLLWGYRLLSEAATWRAAFIGGVVLAVPAVIKVTPALPAVAAVATWGLARGQRLGRRFAAAGPLGLVAGAVLFLLLIPAALLGWNANWRHLQSWRASILSMAVEVDPGSVLESPFTVRNQSLGNAAYRFGNWFDHAALGGPDDQAIDVPPYHSSEALAMDAPIAQRAIFLVRLGLLALLTMAGWKAARSGEPRQIAALFGLACAASLIVSPLSRGHYFVLLLPAVVWGTGFAASSQRLHGLAALLCLLVGLHYAFLDTAGRVGLLGLGTTVWFIVAAIQLAMRRNGSSRCAAECDMGSGQAILTTVPTVVATLQGVYTPIVTTSPPSIARRVRNVLPF